MKYLAGNLKWLREQRGLRQSNIPGSVGFKSSTWNNYERGVSKPGLDDLIKISKYFGVSETELLHVDLSEKKIASVDRIKTGHKENLLKEEGAVYKQMSELVIEAQQGQIQALQLVVEQLKNKIQRGSAAKK